MAQQPPALAGLDEPETTELQRRLHRPVLAFETLPRTRADPGRLLVEHPHFMDHFVPVERVAYHAIFEDDFDFLTALALWGGPCLSGARWMMDLRLRLPGLVRAVAVTLFGSITRGYAGRGSTVAGCGRVRIIPQIVITAPHQRELRANEPVISERSGAPVIGSGQGHLGAGRRAHQTLLQGQVLRDPMSARQQGRPLLGASGGARSPGRPFEGREIRIPADPSELLPLLAESGRCGLSLIGDREREIMLAGTACPNCGEDDVNWLSVVDGSETAHCDRPRDSGRRVQPSSFV
jgi:hypothetical protein